MRLFAGLLIIAALLGCRGSNPAVPRGSRDIVTREQLEALHVADAWEVVQRLRAEFVTSRGTRNLSSGPDFAVVYVDGVRRGGPETLRGLWVAEILEIRFVSPVNATTRYGTDHGGGAIEVKLRHGSRS